MKRYSGFLLVFIIMSMGFPVQAQWWGSDSLLGEPENYTYRTRFGNWQFGGELRNISTAQPFADRGIIRNWEDGMPIAVDRNIPGGRFAQQGVPRLVYMPQIDYYDNSGYLTDVRYREGLRQYWPEDHHILTHKWEQITYEPEANAATSPPMTRPASNASRPQRVVTRPQASPAKKQQIIIVNHVPQQPPKLTYHQQIMQAHAERRVAGKERQNELAQQYEKQQSALAQNDQNASWLQNSHEPQMTAEPQWFRDVASLQNEFPQQPQTSSTYIIPRNPALEIEKRLEYSLVQSPDISFYSSFQTKFENGTVTVTGMVGSEQERQLATQILLTQPEVRRVQNNLTIAQ